MKIEDFQKGLKLEYEDTTCTFLGYVNFIDPEYITLTLCTTKNNTETPLRETNLVIYPYDWKKLKTVPV
tara:strand:+ start:285 stop:491 length:207 start_codon:yes stop_codon:yes gene_type:complete